MLREDSTREARLPVWARELLRDLRGELARQGAALAVYRKETVAKGNITVQEGMGEEINLPDHSTICMGTKMQRLQFNLVDGEVRVYSHGKLLVQPWASNSIRLRSK